MRIDAHQHFWQYDPVKGAWITDEMQVIRQDFMPGDLKPLLDSHDIDGCVAVQADQSERENEFLLELTEQNTWIKGVVGWLDLKADDLTDRMEHYQQYDSFKGVRHILQAEPEGFMTDPKFIKGVAQIGASGMTYDILTTENQLEEAIDFVKALPEMPLVIDHISKPNIAQASYDHWAKHMLKLSEFQHVNVKISGMITEADWKEWRVKDIKPYVDFCLENFGPERLMYGSDWPVCLIAGEYDQVIYAIKACLAELSISEQEAIYGKTASLFYKLKE
ncbi:MAG: amidohydrolase [Flammeovirgaceae bacterium]|nr:amidohydrolase [Flammeovirgaceae bacterium]HCX23439.1 amidohydrolase [Cytophagales bacterium]|tara:strand:- start:1021 stop:1851 length:831 start_codon:yes stop_codon:yes gene_type:complete